MNKLSKLVRELSRISKSYKADNFVEVFEDKLSEFLELDTSEIIDPLLSFFDDNSKYDELMFSIIHTIEVFEDDIYTKKIIHNLRDFCLKSPKWASIIHMRILNSESTLNAYLNNLKIAPKDDLEILELLLKSMGKQGEDINEKVSPLLREVTNNFC